MRAAALAFAAVAAFIGVMYLRFSGDTVPAPATTPSTAPTPLRVQAPVDYRCENYARFPKPPQCGGLSSGPIWWGVPTVPPTPPPVTPPVIPEVFRDYHLHSLAFGPETELPTGIVLIIPTVCGNCGGDSGGYSRVYRDAQGRIRTDTLVTLESLGLSPGSDSNPNGAYFTGLVADEDGSPIAVSVCKQGACFPRPGSPPPAGAEAGIYRSVDGGVSWSELDVPDSVSFVSGVLPDGRIIAGDFSQSVEFPSFTIWPGGELLTSPEPGYGAPITVADGDIVWPTGGRFVRSDGSTWLAGWADPDQLQFAGEFTFSPTLERALVSVRAQPPNGEAEFLVVFRTDGTLERVYSASGSVRPFAWLDDARVLGNVDTCRTPVTRGPACVGFGPALIDLESQLISPLRPLGDQALHLANVLAVQRGPFARVVNTEGTCVYIRESPNSAAPALDCAAEGVLLRDLGETADAEGATWLRVATPAGVEGWASAQYLER